MPDNKDAVKNFYEQVINRKNTVIANSLITEDFKDHNAPRSSDGSREGTKKFFMNELFPAFPDLKITVQQVVGEGDWVAAHVTATGTHKAAYQGVPATNKKFNMAGIEMMRIVNGRIAERYGVFDQAGMLTQLGVIQPPATAGAR